MRHFFCLVGCLVFPLQVQAQIVDPADPHYNVVALRVEFAPDTSRFTTGDGTFSGLTYPLESKVDPLPHGSNYFQAHLDFLAHYIKTASGGNTVISTYLIPEIVQLDSTMGSYSPLGEDSGRASEQVKLASLVHESWTEADRRTTFNPHQLSHGETAFILFHAGVGRDIELIGTTLNKTPLDLPSVFMDSETLESLGVSGLEFKGIPVDHTILLPRTETRVGLNSITDQPYLLELSINGLMAASFMNFLGVPDLFNTETGESVIGPFGLMDPLGIFAYGGLFPPLPSAWTRISLGWVLPKHVQDSGTYDLAAGQVAKIEVSPAEYFLLENRVRNPDNQGLTLQIFNQDTYSTQTFLQVADNFNRFNIEAFQGGVVTQVNTYDFALPGRDSDQQQYNGGILIWHVDERQFSHAVNNETGMRAVDIEEADGAQDIGFDGNIGSPFDFYYAGNPSSVSLPSGRTIRLYENRFGPETYPDSRTNSGGESFVTLQDFSASGSVMSFSFEKNMDGSAVDLGSISLGEDTGREGSLSQVGDHVALFTGTQVLLPDAGLAASQVRPVFQSNQIATVEEEPGGSFLFRRYEVLDKQLDLIESTALPTQLSPVSPVVYHEGGYYVQFTNSERSEVLKITSMIDSYVLNDVGVGLTATDRGMYVFGQSEAGPLDGTAVWTYDLGAEAGAPVTGRDRTGLWAAVSDAETLLLLQPNGSVLQVTAATYFGKDQFSKELTFADLNQDGVLDIVTTVGSQVVAFSQGGALLPPFPIAMDAFATSSPLVYESDASVIVVVATTNGTLHAFDLAQRGANRPGFPLSAGFSVKADPLLSADRLSAVTESGVLRSYGLKDMSRIQWGEQHGGGQNHGFVALVSEPVQAPALLSSTETYNWPNPIRDGFTFFRCMTHESSDVAITIVDTAGSLIDSMTFTTSAGSPHEILWHTDAVSGLYYARVKATSVSGATDSHLIKLAIIR